MTDVQVDVFVGNQTIVDPGIYDLWLGGYSVQEAANIQKRSGILQKYGATVEDLLSEINDYYRLFVNLEKLLSPPRLQDQHVYQINTETQKLLIERYYRFDACVLRELLGKKLTARNRKDLDDVCEKTRIPLRSCRRQFDNVKRVFKAVEDMMGSLVGNIQKHYLLPSDLAQQYAAVVFITNNRFDTGKKKLSHLTFEDFVSCANLMIRNWSYSSEDCTEHEDKDADFDRDFLQQLREFKILTDKDFLEEHKQIVSQLLKNRLSEKAQQDLEVNFKNISKILINIAYGLNHSKEARDIFIDLVEKLIEPCMIAKWNKQDVESFLTAYKEACHQMEYFTSKLPHYLPIWERYMNTLASCILQLYHT